MRRALAFVADWRNVATLLASAVIALAIVSYIEAVQSRAQALDAAKEAARAAVDARAAASRRIDLLSAQLAKLNAQLVGAQEDRAILYTQLAAVIGQLQQLGAEPVVSPSRRQTASGGSQSSPSPSAGPASPKSRPTASPSPRPSPSPSPTCRRLPIVGCRPTPGAHP